MNPGSPNITEADAATLVQGVSPVLEVPFHRDGAVDFGGFERVVQHVLKTGVTSVMFPGFASEFHKLSPDEHRELRDLVLSHTRGNPHVATIASVHDHATYLAVQRALEAVAAGADVLNVLPPYFLGTPPAAVRDHLAAVLRAVDPTPVVVQYAPGSAGTSVDATLISELARQHPNLRLIKVESNPPGRVITALADARPPVPALVGMAGLHLVDGLRRGAVGVQPGCSFVEVYQEIWRRFASSDDNAGDELSRRLVSYLSYWATDVELIIAVEKLISTHRGWFESSHCRAPAYRLDHGEVQSVDNFMSEFSDYLLADF